MQHDLFSHAHGQFTPHASRMCYLEQQQHLYVHVRSLQLVRAAWTMPSALLISVTGLFS